MPTNDQSFTIDGTEYPLKSLSTEARSQLQMLQITDQEIQRLQWQLAIAQTARNAYAQALRVKLPTAVELAQQSDTLKLN
jgi:hypothetical protein